MKSFEAYYDEARELSNFELNRLLNDKDQIPKEKLKAVLTVLGNRGALDEMGTSMLNRLNRNGNRTGDSTYDRENLPRSPLSDPNITTDPDAPVLYSRYAIRFIAIIASPLVAGILLAINLSRINKKNLAYFPVVLGLVFTIVIQVLTFRLLSENHTLFAILGNVAAAILLEELVWNRFIGKNFRFRRQYLLPLIMALMMILLLLTLLMNLTAM